MRESMYQRSHTDKAMGRTRRDAEPQVNPAPLNRQVCWSKMPRRIEASGGRRKCEITHCMICFPHLFLMCISEGNIFLPYSGRSNSRWLVDCAILPLCPP